MDMIFGLRANAYNYVGFCYDAAGAPVSGAAALRLRPLCSPALMAEPLVARGQHAPPAKDAPPVPRPRISLRFHSSIIFT